MNQRCRFSWLASTAIFPSSTCCRPVGSPASRLPGRSIPIATIYLYRGPLCYIYMNYLHAGSSRAPIGSSSSVMMPQNPDPSSSNWNTPDITLQKKKLIIVPKQRIFSCFKIGPCLKRDNLVYYTFFSEKRKHTGVFWEKTSLLYYLLN